MKYLFQNRFNSLNNLLFKNALIRKLLFIFADSINILLSLIITNWFLKEKFNLFEIYFYTLPLALLLFIFTGQYKALSRYVGSQDFYKISFRNLSILIYQIIIFNKSLNFQYMKQFFILNFIIYTFLSGILRFIFRDLLKKFYSDKNQKIPKYKKRALIYGAGSAGGQLAASLDLNNNYQICGFLDDNLDLQGRELSGYTIYNPKDTSEIINKFLIDEILIAMPSVSKGRKSSLIKNFTNLGVKILQIPSLNEIHKGLKQIKFLKEIEIEDLLQRESVEPDFNLIKKEITENIICITGAGGSIGSELCSQILQYNPEAIILIELSEINLYAIERKLIKNYPEMQNKIYSYLGNANDKLFIELIFRKHKINLLLHTAAYKHVPLLESNPLQAIKNNIFTTRNLCKLSKKYKINHMVLISTDKAVRPTNIMGATKRVSEIIIQGYAKEAKNNITYDQNKNMFTSFSIVRFGNVLGSSGSVVPLFQEQINNGGPITITHPEIIRYLMSIKEAVELVLQAVALEKNGDILLLDMGDPIKIIDLAKQMIKLNGLTIKDKNNQNGDIELVNIGLRRGEKLYEELLIDKNSQKTSHPLIYRGIESSPNLDKINIKLDELERELDLLNKEKCISILKLIVPEWVDQII